MVLRNPLWDWQEKRWSLSPNRPKRFKDKDFIYILNSEGEIFIFERPETQSTWPLVFIKDVYKLLGQLGGDVVMA